MAKQNTNIFNIFIESIGLYFSNFDKFFKYMTFPVLGQILGLSLIMLISYFYYINIDKLIARFPIFNDIMPLVFLSVLVSLPGIVILMKAIWNYMLAYGAINSMFENMTKSGRVYDFSAHNELVTRKIVTFIGLWFMFGIFTALAVLPPFWIICGIAAIYFVLSFQAFTFEQQISPIGCLKKSFTLIKGSFVKTFLLYSVVTLLTYFLLPQLTLKILNYFNITQLLVNLLLPFANLYTDILIANNINISMNAITLIFVEVIIAQILIQYTLPLRSILWALWYKDLEQHSSYEDGGKISKTSNVRRSNKQGSKKRPSEILMKKSHKKFCTKKLDRNIIKRASKKDEN